MLFTDPSFSTRNRHNHANALLRTLVDRYSAKYGLGTMSPSVYDTAWVSMVSKSVNDQIEWVFPDSFRFICKSQSKDGSWQSNFSLTDTIATTLTCLLALKRHQSAKYIFEDCKGNITRQADRAITFLEINLDDLCLESSHFAFFELIIPTLLELLENEHGIKFNYHHRDSLLAHYKQKLAEIDYSNLYKSHVRCHYSLEGLIGKVDFDRLTNLKYQGNFMASPAATAVYIMQASIWDNEAEEYLRHVIKQCQKYGNGAVCSVWPNTIFEFSSVSIVKSTVHMTLFDFSVKGHLQLV